MSFRFCGLAPDGTRVKRAPSTSSASAPKPSPKVSQINPPPEAESSAVSEYSSTPSPGMSSSQPPPSTSASAPTPAPEAEANSVPTAPSEPENESVSGRYDLQLHGSLKALTIKTCSTTLAPPTPEPTLANAEVDATASKIAEINMDEKEHPAAVVSTESMPATA